MRRSFLLALFCLWTASLHSCGKAANADGVSAAGLSTVFDSTGDTVVARVASDLRPSAVRQLNVELSIAPSADDTTLFTEISEFDVDQKGRLWVFDRPSTSILLFRPDGTLERRIGRRGSGPGEFSNNSGMVVLRDGRLAIWDSQNARISFFKATGDFDRVVRHSAGFNTSNGLVTDTAGRIYVKRPVAPASSDDSFWRLGLVQIGEDGAWLDSLDRPVIGVTVTNYVSERRESGGSFSRNSTNVSFAPVAHWTWHPHGYFVSGHGGKYQVHLSRTTGQPIRIERDLPPVATQDDERANEEEMILSNMRSNDPSWTWSGPPVPSTKAPLMSLFTARDGRIWTRVAVPSEPIPESERVIPRTATQSVRRWRTPTVYEVFSADGEFLGRVAFPPRTALMEADGNSVWAIGRDSLDLPAVLRFRIAPALGRQ